MFNFTMRGQKFEAATLAELSNLYGTARHDSGEGGSTFPTPTVKDGSKRIGRFSYNGRIWASKVWTPDELPLYDNRAA